MSQFFDRVVEHVDRIGDVDYRPAALLIFFDEGGKNIELVALLGPGCGAPEPFDLAKSRSVIIIISNGLNVHVRVLELRDGQGVNPVVLGMRSDELDEGDASAKIESDDHPKITAGDFEPGAFAIQYFCIGSGKTHIVHRTPFRCSDQSSPSMERRLRLRMPVGIRREHAPCDNPHRDTMFPKWEHSNSA